MSLKDQVEKIPEGFSLGVFRKKKYGITKQIFNQGKSFKIFGKDLEGTDMISLNFYITKKQDILRPCEMPEQKVIVFLQEVLII